MATALHIGDVPGKGQEFAWVPLSRIRPDPDQPRQYFDEEELQQLAASLRTQGQVVALIVTPIEGDPEYDYLTVDGERRLRAFKMAGIVQVAVDVRHYASAAARFRASFVANFGRVGHQPMETARALQRIYDSQESAADPRTQRIQKISDMCAMSTTWVDQHLRLLNLPPEVQAMMEPTMPKAQRIGISMGIFLGTIDNPSLQVTIAREVSGKGLKVNAARALARAKSEEAGARIGSRPLKPSDVLARLRHHVKRIEAHADTILGVPNATFRQAVASQGDDGNRGLVRSLDKAIAALTELRGSIDRAGGQQA